ncbi:hypothetical protein [uncultured Pelagimonas sp.]|uniref:hypothetical protein n=1 Tax=uncultured Pelagimonas sp. TaxID=1618102 RepID=UPI002630F418|nr:hypothetical protein [uncultured Pelagimonas sp.]
MTETKRAPLVTPEEFASQLSPVTPKSTQEVLEALGRTDVKSRMAAVIANLRKAGIIKPVGFRHGNKWLLAKDEAEKRIPEERELCGVMVKRIGKVSLPILPEWAA